MPIKNKSREDHDYIFSVGMGRKKWGAECKKMDILEQIACLEYPLCPPQRLGEQEGVGPLLWARKCMVSDAKNWHQGFSNKEGSR
jgi:hypothetical protein